MGFPLPPSVPQLLIALQALSRSTWAGRLPDVTAGEAFWASSRDAPKLVADGFAEYAPAGTAEPPPEPAWTVRGVPGFGAGTSNSSHQWVPQPGGRVDGGAAVNYTLEQGGTIDGGPDAGGGSPAGSLDGGSA